MKHLIIGAGPAGVVAAETLRKLDPEAEVVIVGDEPEPPYSRMAIPYLLIDNIDEPGTYLRKSGDHYSGSGIEVVVDRVESVDAKGKTLALAGGGLAAWIAPQRARAQESYGPASSGLEDLAETSQATDVVRVTQCALPS